MKKVLAPIAMVGAVALIGVPAPLRTNAASAVQVEDNYEYVSKVVAGEDSYLLINVKGNFRNAQSCSNGWYAKSKYPLADDRTKAVLSIATASFLGRKGVHTTTQGCTSDGRLVLVQIQAQQD